MRVLVLAVAASLLASLVPSTGSAAGATLPLACAAYGDRTICSGTITSFDGTPLDVDLTLPTGGGRHPLMVMINGFGNDKHEWEATSDAADGADKWHWNSHWFSGRGFYVMTYTPRGFQTSAASGYQPPTPAGTSESMPNGTIHLKSREFEIRDTQYLAQLVAASHSDLDTDRVAVTGGSYGGGESWLQATQPVWQVDRTLPALRLQVALPEYGWTDLCYSLAPNGHPGPGAGDGSVYNSSCGYPEDPGGAGNPVGVAKASYVAGFYAVGQTSGRFEEGLDTTSSQEAAQDGRVSVSAWLGRVMGVGEPYDYDASEDPLVRQLRRGLTVFRSSYYQDAAWREEVRTRREVAVFSVQGWTDDLFPAVESFREFEHLKDLDPKWPVQLMLADVGHARAQNPAAQWQVVKNAQNAFLADQLRGSHRPSGPAVTSLRTSCAGVSTDAITAATPEGLAAGTANVEFITGGSTNSAAGLADPNGAATDAVGTSKAGALLDKVFPGSGGACKVAQGPATGGFTGTSQPLPAAVTLAGIPTVRVAYQLTGGPSAEVDVRLWDVTPGGPTTLVSRGTYRLETTTYDAASGTISVPMYGNHWAFPAGHQVRLDINGVDAPTYRPTTTQWSLGFDAPRLALPIAEPATYELTGA